MDEAFLQFSFPSRITGQLAVTNVTVVPMDSERLLPDQTVLIEDGKITALGPSSQINVENAQRIDGSDKYLMPGLSDMYSHYREPAEAILYLAHGVTTTRSVGSLFQLAMERVAERGDYPSPHLVTLSPAIDGLGPTGRTDMPGGVPMTDPSQAHDLVRRFAERGFHQIKSFSLMTPENIRALGKASADAGLRLVSNCPNAMSYEQAIEAGVTCFEQLHIIARDHMLDEYEPQEYWDRFDPVPGTRMDFDKIRRLGNLLAEKQVWNVPTVVFQQRISQYPEIALKHPSVRYARQATVNDWETTIIRWAVRGRITVEAWQKAAQIRAKAFLKVISIFHEEGAPLMTGTDSLNPYIVQGDSLHQELRNFVEAGMTPYQALRSSSVEAARFLDQLDTWGTVEKGKRADLVLLGSNPLEGLNALDTIDAVFCNGYYLTRAEMDSMLDHRAEMVKVPPKLPTINLPVARGEGEIVEEGTWMERISGGEYGHITFRHNRLANGDWLIEERHAGADPRRHLESHTVHLILTPDFRVRSGKYTNESFAGEESYNINWSESEGYNVKHTELDGNEVVLNLAGAMKVPNERLALSVLPLMLSQVPEVIEGTSLPTLTLEYGTPSLLEMAISKADEQPADGNEIHWKMAISRPSETTEQIYRLTPDGRFLGMEETMTLLWFRELIPLTGQG